MSAPYFMHIPGQISNSPDSSVVLLTYSETTVTQLVECLTCDSQFTLPKKHLSKTLHFHYLVLSWPRKMPLHDWHIVDCDIEQWLGHSNKYLVMCQTLWQRQLFRGWQLGSRSQQGFQKVSVIRKYHNHTQQTPWGSTLTRHL